MAEVKTAYVIPGLIELGLTALALTPVGWMAILGADTERVI